MFVSNGNRTEWSTIQGVIGRVISNRNHLILNRNQLSGVFSISPQVKISMTSFPAFSRLFVFGWLFVYTVKRTLHVSSKIWILCSSGKNNIYLCSSHSNIKIPIFSPPCNKLCKLSNKVHLLKKIFCLQDAVSTFGQMFLITRSWNCSARKESNHDRSKYDKIS